MVFSPPHDAGKFVRVLPKVVGRPGRQAVTHGELVNREQHDLEEQVPHLDLVGHRAAQKDWVGLADLGEVPDLVGIDEPIVLRREIAGCDQPGCWGARSRPRRRFTHRAMPSSSVP